MKRKFESSSDGCIFTITRKKFKNNKPSLPECSFAEFITPSSLYIDPNMIQHDFKFDKFMIREPVSIIYAKNVVRFPRILEVERAESLINDLLDIYPKKKKEVNKHRQNKKSKAETRHKEQQDRILKILEFKSLDYSTQLISKITGFSISNINHIIRNNQDKLSKEIDSIKMRTKYSQIHLDNLNNFILSNKGITITLTDMKNHLLKHTALSISETTISRMLKKLNISYKRSTALIINRNTERTLQIRHDKIFELLAFHDLGFKMIYLDESSFNLNLSNLYGYAKKNEKFVSVVPPKSENISLLAAVSDDGILGFMVFKGSVKGNDYGAFILKLIDSNEIIKNNLENYVFCMDNARIHAAKAINHILLRLNTFYLPPYSPFLNPIEEVFGLWKFIVRKTNRPKLDDLLKAIIDASKQISKEHMKAYIRHTIKFFKKCIQKEIIE